MVPMENVARILGVERRVASIADLRRLIDQGLPKRSLGHVVEYVSETPGEAARLRDRIVPPATFKRRSSALKPEEGEKVERLARVAALAEVAFGSQEDALGFLHESHPELAGETPLDAARSELGARQVEEILWRMEHGLPL
jgi:putative toxin-antitoxin system antitoxin component (TIGR02293 family)